MAKKPAAKKAATAIVLNLKKIKGSSNIDAIGYDAPSSTLEVQFSNGTRYTFTGVPKDKYEALMRAKSKGEHFSKHIRGQYEFQRI